MQIELVLQLLVPLLAQVSWDDDEDAATTLAPTLRDDKTRFNRLSEPDLVSQDYTARKRILADEQCGFDLMGIEIHL